MFALILAGLALLAAQGCKRSRDEGQARKAAKRVKTEFLHAWNGYARYAWGHDALRPLIKMPHDWYGQSLQMTPVDALDTLILMKLDDEAAKAQALIANELSFDRDIYVKNFEITIRLLGGLLSSYQLDRTLRSRSPSITIEYKMTYDAPAFSRRWIFLRHSSIVHALNTEMPGVCRSVLLNSPCCGRFWDLRFLVRDICGSATGASQRRVSQPDSTTVPDRRTPTRHGASHPATAPATAESRPCSMAIKSCPSPKPAHCTPGTIYQFCAAGVL